MKRRSLFLIIAAAATGASMADSPDAPVIREGWDWSLPQKVKPVDYSGYITWGSNRFHPSITVRGVMTSWKQLNPAPGEYRWDWLREEIARNKAAGMRTGIHLKGVQRDAVPDWVVERFKPVVLDVPVLQENQPWRIRNVPPWQPEVDAAFLGFLREFAKTGIAQDDSVVYGYIHGISPSRGEEMFIRPVDWQMWQETTGVTAEQFAAWLRRRIDAMCEVFHGVEYKLAVTWGAPLSTTGELRAATAGLHDYAFTRGCGIRGGALDFMHTNLEAAAWGTSIGAGGHLLCDDEHPTIAQRRFRGDENEEYGDHWEWRFGPSEGDSYRHRISVLRGLQMRQNFQLVSPATLKLNPELNEYARITQGFRRDDSPDAWAYLREFERGHTPIKNIERWLVQRDAPGSLSVPAERIDRFPLPSESKSGATAAHDFDARRTDIEHGQNGLLFALDREFWDKPQPATIKVTYTDRQPTTWLLRYADASGKISETPSIENTGDGKRKTATFLIDGLAATGAFPNDPVFLAWRNEPPAQHGNQVANPGFNKNGAQWQSPSGYTITEVSSENHGQWEIFTQTFKAPEQGKVRLQLFGQGRHPSGANEAGETWLRDISIEPVTREELAADLKTDFRLVATGPGDLTVTMVRIIKGTL